MCKTVFIVEGRGVVSKNRVADFARVGVLLTEMAHFATMVKVTVMDNALTTMAGDLEGMELTAEEMVTMRETLGVIRHEMEVMKMRPYGNGQRIMEDAGRKVSFRKQHKTIRRLGVAVKDLMCSILTFSVSGFIIACIYISVYYMCVKYSAFYSRLYSSGCFLKRVSICFVVRGVDGNVEDLPFL